MLELIVDSTCDLNDELMKKYELKYIPHRIYLNDTEYYDKVTINADEVYNAMKKGAVPMTSMPAPKELSDRFRQCCENGRDFLFLSISSKLSGTYQLASSLSRELPEQYPNIKMAVIDTKSSSTAVGLIALQAAKLSRSGEDFNTVVGQAKELSDHAEHIFMVQDLSWLVKGGRLIRAEGLVGKILNVKPILHVKDGSVELLEKTRGRKKTLFAIVDIMEERMKGFQGQPIGVSHSDDKDTAYELAAIITQRLGVKDIMINQIGATLTSHLGVGGVGVFFFNKRPKLYIE